MRGTISCKYIENPLIELVTAATTPEAKTIVEKNEKKCKSLLVQCIHDSQLEYIKDRVTAKDIYDTLVSVFEPKSVARQLLLRKQLLTMKYSDGCDIKRHFLIFDKAVRDLKAIGATMEEMDVLILTMPKSFETLVTALETIDKTKLTLDFVKSRSMDEYSKRNSVSVGNKSDSGTQINWPLNVVNVVKWAT